MCVPKRGRRGGSSRERERREQGEGRGGEPSSPQGVPTMNASQRRALTLRAG